MFAAQGDPTEAATAAPRKGVSQRVVAALLELLGPDGVLTGDDVSTRNPGVFMSRIEADVLVRPTRTAEVSRVMEICHAASQPVVVQGGMSGWVRATQTRPGDVVLSLERMKAIEEIDTVNRTATVQAGVILQTLQEEAARQGLFFPINLGGRGSCQLGGNASTNAGGERVIRYGMMREQILGLEAVLADGRVISSLNHMIKNNTGYDLKQLFIGSEGSLGVITRLVVRLREKATSSNTALVCATRFEQVARLLRHMDASLGGSLSAFELMDNAFYRVNTTSGRHAPPLPTDRPLYVIVESLGCDQDRDTAAFEQALMSAVEIGIADDVVVAKSDREREAIWIIREDLQHIVRDFSPFYAFDISLPVGDMAGYMDVVRQRVKSAWPEGSIAFLGHVGDGNLHIAVGAGGADDRTRVEACIYEPLAGIGGSISAEHGIGLEKKPWLSVTRNAEELRLMRQLKQTLDPQGILNPGKIFDMDAGAAT
ncbi:MAG: FAD-binding oxidoreductase [Nevskiaceae bacterium]|nr:MAG: FAD-binding oxidoreductase [Nevskiaceae bacterium]TBR71414.1 MAG: FAD-binding oxidoreductase [Nevskiaceae bacterium]